MKTIPIRPVPVPSPTAQIYTLFCSRLKEVGFRGEIGSSHAERTVLATDNSIYQRLPQVAVYPLDAQDVQVLARLASDPQFHKIVLTARGGGTGTNGQSLTDGVVVDVSRHMNKVIDIDAESRTVRVQAGVVKDQLNAALKPHGLFFAPELSTSNRATIGGMINTDASGQGSCTYGKTRDHVISLSTVLLGGELHQSAPVTEQALDALSARQDMLGKVYRTAREIIDNRAQQIEAVFPKLNRCLTGYDLAHLRDANGAFNLNSILCGAEGTLGFIVEATLSVLPIPRYSTLVNVRYASFMEALRDAQALMQLKPLSIETVDSKVLTLAMRDIVWQKVAEYFPQDSETATQGINLVEFSGDDEQELAARVQDFEEHLQRDTSVVRLGHTLAQGAGAVNAVYAMRKRAVGLLGNVDGEQRPQPFVEDTAVPPENLADYIAEFRGLLDGYGLQYGMFGHVDAGVLHVRPALDMKDANQAALVRPITEAVAQLTHKYGGLLWGEHGKGLRSEYAPKFFGELYPALQQIKAAFDPHNQLNPGKIATPASEHALLRVDEVALRGDADRQIDERVWQSYGTAMHCNGNGACYNYDLNDAMCPSWKATRERVHSPKGRASLIREWLRLQQNAGVDVLAASRSAPSFLLGLPARWMRTKSAKRNGEADFSHQVYDAMAGCLACKSCVGQCPVKVNVPEFRSRFLELYHTRYLRPLKDYFIGSLEFTVPYLARVPGLYNGGMSNPLIKRWLQRSAGMVDSPLLSTFDLDAVLRKWNVRTATPALVQSLPDAERKRTVIFVQDAFTRYFETPVFASLVELASKLGYQVLIAPFLPNGKPLHVQGFLRQFERAAKRNVAQLEQLAQGGIPLVGLDPAMTLAYRQEYRKIAGLESAPEVLLPQEWLLQAVPKRDAKSAQRFRLLGHCTERTNAPSSTSDWQAIFTKLGQRLDAPSVGCCGMSGTYGHEARNVATSQKIFEQSWAPAIQAAGDAEILATGYSCRSQVDRQQNKRVRHPVEALLELI